MIKTKENEINEARALQLYSEKYSGDYSQSRQLGGDVNHTFLLTNIKGDKVVFQRLSKIFNEKLVADFVVVTEHLTKEGWIVPQLIYTKDNNTHIQDKDGFIWRAITFVESSGTPAMVDTGSVGSILARFHKTLALLDYKATFTLDHYHDTDFYFEKLDQLESQLNSENRLLSQAVKHYRAELPKLPEIDAQLIHADPRVDNILFKGSQPFTFIDFDTIMNGPVWIDLSDFIRSIIEKQVQQKTRTDFAEIKSFCDEYIAQSDLQYSNDEFYAYVLLATQHMAIELAARFLNDVVEDYYFVWENTPYNSRNEHNIARVKQQLEICRIIEENNG